MPLAGSVGPVNVAWELPYASVCQITAESASPLASTWEEEEILEVSEERRGSCEGSSAPAKPVAQATVVVSDRCAPGSRRIRHRLSRHVVERCRSLRRGGPHVRDHVYPSPPPGCHGAGPAPSDPRPVSPGSQQRHLVLDIPRVRNGNLGRSADTDNPVRRSGNQRNLRQPREPCQSFVLVRDRRRSQNSRLLTSTSCSDPWSRIHGRRSSSSETLPANPSFTRSSRNSPNGRTPS